MQRFWDGIVDFCQKLTRRVEKDLLADFGKVSGEEKEDGSLVTIADKRADQQIRKAIQEIFPTHGMLTEEGDETIFPENDWCWIVDPLDGTHNFVRGIPFWGISLGLLYLGKPVFGYVHFPSLQQRYHGFCLNPQNEEAPHGAFFNEKTMTLCAQEFEKKQFFTFCSRSIHVAGKNFPCKVRVFGSSAYDLIAVAGGRTLGAIELNPKIWDLVGAYPIIHAVGAHWRFLKNDPFPLKKGQEYLHESFPVFVIARKELEDIFFNYAKSLI